MLNAKGIPLQEELRVAASNGNTADVLELLEDGATFDVDSEGRTVLHLAAQFGHADTVAALLLAGCDCNASDYAGHTPLQRAAAEGHVEIVKQLLKHGAKVDKQDEVHGNTALHEAAWKGYSQTLEALCKAKANVYIKNKGGFAPLHLTCQNGHNQSCRVLLLSGCKPDLKNNYGDTSLHTAARYGHAGVMRILVSAGCKVNEQNKNGDTALHISCAMGRRKLTRILLETKCDQNIRNKQGEAASDIAKRKDFVEIQNILLKPPTQKISVHHNNNHHHHHHHSSTKKSDKKRDKDSGTSSKDSETRHRDKLKKTKHGHKVHFPDKKDPKATKWSPYGCHNYPNLSTFPPPKLDSLPNEPLKKGEQYYLDLSGNICKGPVGVGYACYCAPFFQHVEKKLEGDKQELIKHIDMARNDLQTRMSNLERRTRGRLMHLSQTMQEKIASEQQECRERSERRATQTKMFMEQQQEQCADLVRTELKTWIHDKMADLEKRQSYHRGDDGYHYGDDGRHNVRQRHHHHGIGYAGRYSTRVRSSAAGMAERSLTRSKSEELLTDRLRQDYDNGDYDNSGDYNSGNYDGRDYDNEDYNVGAAAGWGVIDDPNVRISNEQMYGDHLGIDRVDIDSGKIGVIGGVENGAGGIEDCYGLGARPRIRVCSPELDERESLRVNRTSELTKQQLQQRLLQQKQQLQQQLLQQKQKLQQQLVHQQIQQKQQKQQQPLYLETDFDVLRTSPDSGYNARLVPTNGGDDVNGFSPKIDEEVVGVLGGGESGGSGCGVDRTVIVADDDDEATVPEFKMSPQFFDTVTNEMEKWYERRLANIEKRAANQVALSRDNMEGRIQAIEEQLTKLNESFSLSGDENEENVEII